MGLRMVEGADLVVVVRSLWSVYPFAALPGRAGEGLLRVQFIMSGQGGLLGGWATCFYWAGVMRQ